MSELYATHGGWVILAILVIAITLTATIYSFWRRRYIDGSGPRKGTAANPDKVKRENPPDH